jgi:hypothetical protein
MNTVEKRKILLFLGIGPQPSSPYPIDILSYSDSWKPTVLTTLDINE